MAVEVEVVGVVTGDTVVKPEVSLTERVARMQNELDMPGEMVEDLLGVAGADIVVVADDSGSMSCRSGQTRTRWEELKETLRSLVKMLLVVDHSDGFDVTFLNDPEWYKIKSENDVDVMFNGRQPRGGTPLMHKCKPILDGSWHPKGSAENAETDLLLLVMTDGEPSDCSFAELKSAVAKKASHVYVTFLMCTDEDGVVSKYNRYMDPVPNVDIVDDFQSEKKEVERRGRHLSYFTWLGKSVLGAKLPKYDKMDDPKCCTCSIQ